MGIIKSPLWVPGRNQEGIAGELWRSCVGYWPFWERAGDKAYDLGGRGITGSLTNMTAADWIATEIGGALNFPDANDYVNLGDCQLWDDISTEGTIVIWTYPIALPEGGSYRYAIARRQAVDLWQILLNGDAGGAVQFIANGGTLATLQGSVPTVNEWRHYAVTWSPSAGRLYENGIIAASNAGGTIGTGTQQVWIGNGRVAANRPWDGAIAGAGIFNRPLSAQAVQYLSSNSFCMIRPPAWSWGFTASAAAAAFVPYPYPRGLRGGHSALTGGLI